MACGLLGLYRLGRCLCPSRRYRAPKSLCAGVERADDLHTQFIGKWAESSVAGQRAEAAAVIQKYAQLTPGADLSNGRVGASHEITLQNTYYSGTYDAHLVSVSPLKFVDIYCGENVWWRLDYAYIVTEWHNLGRWDGLWRLRSKLGYWGQGVMLFWYNIRIMVRLSSPIG